MKTIGLIALAAVAALVLGFGARMSAPTAHAEIDGSVAIGCEFLIGAIDGDNDDVSTPLGADGLEACDGIDATDVANLANALGDEDDELEASDFDDLDLDDNQIQDGGASISDELVLFGFVTNDGVTTFDATSGVTVVVHLDAGGFSGDAVLPEACEAADDLDCDAVAGGGDGVVVATVSDAVSAASEPGDTVEVDIFQADDTDNVSTQSLNIVGEPDGITLDVLKNPIQVSGDAAADVDDCTDESDVSDSGQLGDQNRTFLKATVTDNDDVELTRIGVDVVVDDDDIATTDDDTGEPGSDPSANTSITVDAGAAGVGYFFVVCGGTDIGTATFTATEDQQDNDADAEVDVVGAPANIALTASPAAIDCNGTSTSTVSATVTDADGNNVADGTNVNFSVVALGTASPINADTTAGVATSTVTPLSGSVAGATVIVTAGDAQASIRVDCNTPAAATATPGGPAPTPTRPGGQIGGPDTGNGGYMGQDSAGFPMWTLVALALGSLALVGGGLVTRRAGK